MLLRFIPLAITASLTSAFMPPYVGIAQVSASKVIVTGHTTMMPRYPIGLRQLAPAMVARKPAPAMVPVVSDDAKIYAWLKWAPPAGTAVYDSLHSNFPGALPGSVILERTVSELEPFGLDGENTLYGQSICPDEINNEKGDLADLMITHWGECFPMGGIGGVPYVGKTGFGAYSAHVPKDGHLVILFGPHIGISSAGELGKCNGGGVRIIELPKDRVHIPLIMLLAPATPHRPARGSIV